MSVKYFSPLYISLLAVFIIALTFRGFKLINGSVISQDFYLYVEEDTKSTDILSEIYSHDNNAKLSGLKVLFLLKKYDMHVKSGCYLIKKGFSARNIYFTLSSGAQTPVKVVIPSTRTVGNMAKSISSQLMLDSTEIYNVLTDTLFMDSVGYPGSCVFALIIPNTYEFYWNVSAEAFIKRMLVEHDKFWNETRKSKAKELGLSPMEITTLASIVEEETSKTDEMPIVAGLYINRLKRPMLLQADPTVIFSLGGERPKRVLKTHLEIDSPYNTYKYIGLPPTPIRFVTPRSIDAVLNYTHHKYLYMCAKEDFSGYHNFATSLSQHNINAKKYQRALSALK